MGLNSKEERNEITVNRDLMNAETFADCLRIRDVMTYKTRDENDSHI